MDTLDNTWPPEFGLPTSITFKDNARGIVRVGAGTQQNSSRMLHPREGKVMFQMSAYWKTIFSGFFHWHLIRGKRPTKITLNLDGSDKQYLMYFYKGVKYDLEYAHSVWFISADIFLEELL